MPTILFSPERISLPKFYLGMFECYTQKRRSIGPRWIGRFIGREVNEDKHGKKERTKAVEHDNRQHVLRGGRVAVNMNSGLIER